MPLDDRDLSYLLDMHVCIKDILEYTAGVSFHEFETNKMRKLAVERQLEVIGQAAIKVSAATQTAYPSIPWAQIIGLRNKLAHDYGDILAKRIWDISRTSIPALLKTFQTIPELTEYLS